MRRFPGLFTSVLTIAFAGQAPQAAHMAATMPVPINMAISFVFVLCVIMSFPFFVMKCVCSVGYAGIT